MLIKTKTGFTLVELIILLAIIAIIGLIVAGGLSKKAGAAAKDFSPIITELRKHDVQYIYSSTGYLTIFAGGPTWDGGSASDMCSKLKPLDSNLKKVTIALEPVAGTTTQTEIVWNADQTKLSNLDGRYVAVCN